MPKKFFKRANRTLLVHIKTAFAEGRGNYGSPRVYEELRDQGIMCSRNRVARVMRQNGIRVKKKRRFKVTTNSRHKFPVAENVLCRQFSVEKPDQVWGGDITYVYTEEG